MKALSDCLLPHPVYSELSIERTVVYKAVEDFWKERSGGNVDGQSTKRLKDLLSSYSKNPTCLNRYVSDRRLVNELLPASLKLSLYGQAGLKCFKILEERDPEQNAILRREIIELQTRARANPWRVADEQTALTFNILGYRPGQRNVLDDFITRMLTELPR